MSDFLSRLVTYWTRHGLWATLRRVWIDVRRTFVQNRFVIFYFDLLKQDDAVLRKARLSNLSVERKRCLEEIDREDWKRIVEFWNPKITERLFSQRFSAGSSLWLLRLEGALAGYGWTMIGRAMEPYFLPFGDNDVFMYDHLVFPEYRGRRLLSALMTYEVMHMAAESRSRAYFEVAEWNQPCISNVTRTGFRPIGIARKRTVFGRTFIEWGAASRLTEYKSVLTAAK